MRAQNAKTFWRFVHREAVAMNCRKGSIFTRNTSQMLVFRIAEVPEPENHPKSKEVLFVPKSSQEKTRNSPKNRIRGLQTCFGLFGVIVHLNQIEWQNLISRKKKTVQVLGTDMFCWSFKGKHDYQRAENGALDPWLLNLHFWGTRFWGTPIFSPEAPKPLFRRVSERFGAKIGAPQTQIERPRIQRPILGPLRLGATEPTAERRWCSERGGFLRGCRERELRAPAEARR